MDTISRSANYLLCMRKWTLLNKLLKKHSSLNNAVCRYRTDVSLSLFWKGCFSHLALHFHEVGEPVRLTKGSSRSRYSDFYRIRTSHPPFVTQAFYINLCPPNTNCDLLESFSKTWQSSSRVHRGHCTAVASVFTIFNSSHKKCEVPLLKI